MHSNCLSRSDLILWFKVHTISNSYYVFQFHIIFYQYYYLSNRKLVICCVQGLNILCLFNFITPLSIICYVCLIKYFNQQPLSSIQFFLALIILLPIQLCSSSKFLSTLLLFIIWELWINIGWKMFHIVRWMTLLIQWLKQEIEKNGKFDF